jgi:hypothetical protein
MLGKPVAFTPYPLFQWYLQSNEIFQYGMLKPSI